MIKEVKTSLVASPTTTSYILHKYVQLNLFDEFDCGD
jgi:hypothetical protein